MSDVDSGWSNFYDADMDLGRNCLRRVEITKVEDDGEIQKVTCMGLDEEVFDLPYRGQAHGMSGNPVVGSIGYVMMANGRPDQAFLIGIEDTELRPKNLKPGEVKAYAKEKQEMFLDAKGNNHIKTPKGIVYINT